MPFAIEIITQSGQSTDTWLGSDNCWHSFKSAAKFKDSTSAQAVADSYNTAENEKPKAWRTIATVKETT